MSIVKYVGEQSPASHGSPLFWPGVGGFPFRGPTAPSLKESELDDVQVVQDFHTGEFDLGDADAKSRYEQVMDRVVNGWYVCWYREVYRDPQTGKRVAYVEWTQRYGQYAPGSSRGPAVSRVG